MKFFFSTSAKSNFKNLQITLILLSLLASVGAQAAFHPTMTLINIPLAPKKQEWSCDFPKPNGAYDWYNFTPFAPMNVASPYYDFVFRFDNGRAVGNGWFGVPTQGIDYLGIGNKAVLQALYVIALNRGTPSGAYAAPVGGLYPYLEPALKNTIKMDDLLGYVKTKTGITDNGVGSPEELANGLNASLGFYLNCADNYLGTFSKEIYYSVWMPYMDIAAVNNLLYNGTVMILQTNKLTRDDNIGGWVRAANQETYLIKSVRRSNVVADNGLITYTLINVADGKSKVVEMRNGKMRYLLSSGNLSSKRNMTLIDDKNSNYLEVIIGFAGMDPLINRY